MLTKLHNVTSQNMTISIFWFDLFIFPASTAWSRALLEKLIVTQLVKKCHGFLGTWKCIVLLTGTCHWPSFSINFCKIEEHQMHSKTLWTFHVSECLWYVIRHFEVCYPCTEPWLSIEDVIVYVRACSLVCTCLCGTCVHKCVCVCVCCTFKIINDLVKMSFS